MDLTQKIVLAAVTLLIGIILTGVIVGQAYTASSKTVVTGEAITIVRNGTGGVNGTHWYSLANGCSYTSWREDVGTDCQVAILRILNASGTALTVTTDYVANASADGTCSAAKGDFRFATGNYNWSVDSNASTIDYSYCGNDYITQGWGRTTMQMIGGFFAIMLLAFSAGMFYSVYRDVKQ